MLSNFVYNVCGCKGDMEDGLLRGRHCGRPARHAWAAAACCAPFPAEWIRSVAAVLLAQGRGQAAYLRVCRPRPAAQGRGRRGGGGVRPERPVWPELHPRERPAALSTSKLAGVEEPEQKRKIIGEEFIRVFEEEAKKIGTVDYLVQGTIYPDVMESGLGGESAVIKSHHNVGGLPDCRGF